MDTIPIIEPDRRPRKAAQHLTRGDYVTDDDPGSVPCRVITAAQDSPVLIYALLTDDAPGEPYTWSVAYAATEEVPLATADEVADYTQRIRRKSVCEQLALLADTIEREGLPVPSTMEVDVSVHLRTAAELARWTAVYSGAEVRPAGNGASVDLGGDWPSAAVSLRVSCPRDAVEAKPTPTEPAEPARQAPPAPVGAWPLAGPPTGLPPAVSTGETDVVLGTLEPLSPVEPAPRPDPAVTEAELDADRAAVLAALADPDQPHEPLRTIARHVRTAGRLLRGEEVLWHLEALTNAGAAELSVDRAAAIGETRAWRRTTESTESTVDGVR